MTTPTIPRRAAVRRVRRLRHPAPGQPRRRRASTACSPRRSRWPPRSTSRCSAGWASTYLPRAPTTWSSRSGGHDDDALDRGLAAVDRSLAAAVRRPPGPAELAPHRTRPPPCARRPAALVLVSTPGASATVEAMDALDAGADVMLFSDNVPVEQEVALKRVAAERGLLVMGPDCGTAVVGGLGLGLRQRRPARPGRHRRRLRHRLPAAARPARPRRGRRHLGPRRRRPRPVRRGRRAGHPRGPAPPRRRRVGRADRAGLQAAGTRGGGRDRVVRRVAGHARSSSRCWGPAAPT